MANRKLQTEIDRVLKKVSEGVETFESIFDKIQTATSVPQKEKAEGDLKKEIKKLQRYRDNIKTWLSNNDIKDKRVLLENRKLIETQMERFKACEKELKTKAYSKEGLSAAAKLDPAEKERLEFRMWISDTVDRLSTQIDTWEAEQETLALSGKKSKKADTAKHERMKEIEHHIERHRWHMAKLEMILRMVDNGALDIEAVKAIQDDIIYYVEENESEDFLEDDGIYDGLDLDDAEIFGLPGDDDDAHHDKSGSATPSKDDDTPSEKHARANKKSRGADAGGDDSALTSGTPTSATAGTAAAAAAAAADAAAAAAAAAATTPVPAVAAFADLVASFETTKQRSALADGLGSLGAGLAGTPALPGAPGAAAPGEEPVPTAHAMLETSYRFLPNALDATATSTRTSHANSSAYLAERPFPVPSYYPQQPLPFLEPTVPSAGGSPAAHAAALAARNALLEKLGTDTLFFMFYYQQGTLAQSLAARELKRQSWRFHKKYLTWFQRHDEPTSITEEQEQGTYIYFDYEAAWCQRKKDGFCFEYRYLEEADER
ncbi:hypothetical protein CXG81DRAFT_12317 [Caulochytrium protostelioides]|uniref:Not3-domain-containing protein n=1 Tax=Caulochytrium protostelioides TaxID=1555241 RepID=A0A4P9WZQ3_9FUNG|nr:hypothetical protein CAUPRSCDRAFT_5803 [Caulochytrium protostelioides]RKP01163.1 hypothetical protein CXG81DRAFT_12317 [Caulochytrium protostelioides]|eukprot:RKP01163.1 hypothetical protein CXG81DRAFT_12317 [Caulochytrium protostelioides]